METREEKKPLNCPADSSSEISPWLRSREAVIMALVGELGRPGSVLRNKVTAINKTRFLTLTRSKNPSKLEPVN